MSSQFGTTMPANSIIIRPATPQDAQGMARVLIDAQRATYAGVMSDDILNGLSYETGARKLSVYFSGIGDDYMPFVAIEAETDAIVGFSAARIHHGCGHQEGELHTLYVDLLCQRRGIGTRLLAKAARFLGSHGLIRMTVWTLAINPAGAFYEKLGGTYCQERDVEVKGQTLREVCYGYDVDKLWHERD
jgi:ribosomal protein S18 acetylase RimI-like enzyme